MTGGPNRSLEELLSERLHEVDSVSPPDPDFEFRALRAGREKLKRRQAWTRGLVGAAAAVVIGALAVPALGRIGTLGGGGANGTSAGGAGAAASAPEAATGGDASARDLVAPGSPPDGMSLDNVPDSLRVTFAKVRSVLAAPPYDGVYTALTFDPSVPPNGRVVVHLTQPDPGAIAEVRSAFVGGPDVVVEPSAFSLTSCRSTWTTVAADPQVSSQGVTVALLGCDANGRLAVRVAPDAPPATVDHLKGYGDSVYVVGG
jgi:hypothetical protein